jgi:hypothetical protein
MAQQVEFKEWIPARYKNGNLIEGTKCYSSNYKGKGTLVAIQKFQEYFDNQVQIVKKAVIQVDERRLEYALLVNVRIK